MGTETMNICRPNFYQNITMTRTAKVNLKLGDFISVPTDFDIKSSAI